MSIMKIEVLPDTSVAAGGHAIIRLIGVALLPPGATFRIDPIDESITDDDVAGWPYGDLKPLETRQTPQGIELRVGPEVVDAPLLEPGTPVTISIPDGHLSAEILWPDIPLSSARPGGLLVMSPSQLAAEIAANERAKAEQARAAAAAEEAFRAAEAAKRNETERQERVRQDAVAAEAVRKQELEAQRRADAETQRMAQAARDLEAALAQPPPETGRRETSTSLNGSAMPSMAQQPGDRGRVADTALSSLAKGVDQRGNPQTRPHAEREAYPTLASPELDTSLPAIVLKRAADAPPKTMTGAATELRGETIDVQASADAPNRLVPFLAGAGMAAAAALIFALLLPRLGGSPDVPVTGTRSSPSLADVFTAGIQSPRGEIATDVDLPTALRLADYNLHGIDRPVDRAEAEFWLKKAMSLTASHSQLRWAMTQLGTLAAEPVAGTADYDKARMLWEIASQNGDPVATCFLGTLKENGLGEAADRTKAITLFKLAKELGGCPNVDEAIARLSR